MQDVLKETARAKLNLALHVLGRRMDGYHELDSIVAFTTFGDILALQRADEDTLAVTGPFAADVPLGPENLVSQTVQRARTLYEACGVALPPLAITLEKNIPVAAGLGGGSADAAAAMRLIMKQMRSDLPKADLFAELIGLGADVPVCYRQQACRMQGIGELIKPLSKPQKGHLVLVNPLKPCATSEVFRALGLAPGQNHKFGINIEVPSRWRNDLQEPAIAVLPEIAQMLDELALLPGVGRVGMTGSGATCFAFSPSEETSHAMAKALAGAHPQWWVMATSLG
jgi:4-diphosphocytidyl-2-C-methyl-D-erythritol kinase